MYRWIAVAGLLAGCTVVDQTEHCVELRYGNVVKEKMGNGINGTVINDAECFTLVEQNYPVDPDEPETMEAQTGDPITITGDVSIVWKYPDDVYNKVFLVKRNHNAAEIEVKNAIREGYRTALAGWKVEDIFSSERAALSDSVRAHVQRKVGSLAEIKVVFVRDIKIPEAIEAARINAAKQAQVLDQARKQYEIDSVNSSRKILVARGDAELQRVQSEILTKNPAMMQLEVARAQAEAFGKVCAGPAITTCILGGSVMDTWKNGGVR